MEGENELQRIKIEREGSSYIDVNNILKGSWGGYKECYGLDSNGKVLRGVYYNSYYRYVPINDFGFFYGRFDCRKYDGVIKLPCYEFYLCNRNGRYGLLDSDGNIILHTAYKNIFPYYWGWYPGYGMRYFSLFDDNISNTWNEKYKDNVFLIVTTETGKFTYNLITRIESKVYDNIFISGWNHPQIMYKHEDKYGVMDIEGKQLLKPEYDYDNITYKLYQTYKDIQWEIWLENGLLYGRIPINLYDRCFRVKIDMSMECFYITERGKKYGLLSTWKNKVIEPSFDEVILRKPKGTFFAYQHPKITINRKIDDKYVGNSIVFVITRRGSKYWLYNAYKGDCLLEECDNITYQEGKNDYHDAPCVMFKKGDIKGYVLISGDIIDNQQYDEITISRNKIYVSKNGKHGILDITGNAYVPCNYELIIEKGRNKFIGVNDGQEDVYDYSDSYHNDYSIHEPQSFSRYAGTYAQDEMGWSDDDIDTVLDGEPDAYWNID